MWKYYEHNERLDNGDKVNVRVKFNDSNFTLFIDEIELTPKGKRKSSFISHELQDRYDYRRLNLEDRKKAEIKYFIHKVGVEVLDRALLAAWNKIKPNQIAPEEFDVDLDLS